MNGRIAIYLVALSMSSIQAIYYLNHKSTGGDHELKFSCSLPTSETVGHMSFSRNWSGVGTASGSISFSLPTEAEIVGSKTMSNQRFRIEDADIVMIPAEVSLREALVTRDNGQRYKIGKIWRNDIDLQYSMQADNPEAKLDLRMFLQYVDRCGD